MDYLLDTNACIALINGTPQAVRIHFRRAGHGSQIFVSSIAIFELWYGVAKSARRHFNRNRLEIFLSGPVNELPFENEDAEFAGSVRATLEASGEPIGAYDVLIAGQALRHKITLVTANAAEFSRVKGLSSRNWSKL